MPVTDLIADNLTQIRNGSRAKKQKVDIKSSKLCLQILDIFKREGYIKNFKNIADKKQGVVRVYLKYDGKGSPLIQQIKKVSTSGLRVYVGKDEVPKVLNGLGTAVLSTSKGLKTNREAKREKIGGEVICYIW